MVDITDVTPISVLTPKHIGRDLYIDGVVLDVDYDTNQIVLAEPDEYTGTFRKTVSVETISGRIKHGHYIVVDGAVECTGERTWDDVKILCDEYTNFTGPDNDDLSLQKTCQAILDVLEDEGVGTGLPKRYLIEEAKREGASYERGVEALSRLQENGFIAEVQTGLVRQIS